MGEIYRARDTRLGRDAALKVISPRLLADPAVRRRFEIEARAASVLNHPAIVTIYDVGETDQVSWIAMEWVEGRTLRETLSDGVLPLARVMAIARSIADGLAAAHAKGVIHRDLKPENIMLRADGRAKILDFGLARQTVIDAPDLDSLEAQTAARGAATFEGAILGTVGYMSPEQAAGRPVDFRSDQFAFGLLLYEMLTGQRAFERPSIVETLAAIIREDPTPLGSLRPGVPERLGQVIARCLAKRPDERFASTTDLAEALERIPDSPSMRSAESESTRLKVEDSAAVTTPARSRRRPALWIGIGLALALALAAGAWMLVRGSARTIDSLAILPFENAADDAETEYLADGLTESLIDQMSRVPSLKVMARTTVARFAKSGDPRAAGRELNVGAVVAGTITRRGSQVIVSAELVEIATGARLWGETYDRPATDLLRVQDSIAWAIADGLRLSLSTEEKRNLAAHGTDDPEAYELFLKARFLLQYDNEEDDLEARRLYLQAIEKDPKFSAAYLGVATTYTRSAGNGYAPPIDAMSKATEYAQKALDLDPGNFGARVGLAVRHFQYDRDWALAEREFAELSADPRVFRSMGYQPTAVFFWATGRPEQALTAVEGGLRLDPQNTESRTMLADLLAATGRLDESEAEYRAMIEEDPDEPRPLFGLAELHKRRGEFAAAIATLRKAYELTGEQAAIDALAAARTARDLEKAEVDIARHRLEQLEALARERYVSPLDLARLHAKAGSRDRAFALLERALEEKSPGLVYLKVDRMWDPIRSDARFASIVRRIGIP